jgi:hypothetical protein
MVMLAAAVLAVAVVGCGDDDGGNPFVGDAAGDAAADTGGDESGTVNGIDPCTLITDDEMAAVLGRSLPSELGDNNGGFLGCSWNTGDVLVSIAAMPSIVLAPGNEECPSADLGEESVNCPGAVKFWTNGMHVSVSTISNVENDQLLALARVVESKLAG